MKPVRYTQEMVDRYLRQGYWGHPSVADMWDENARLFPDKEVVIDARRRITWSEAKVLSDRLALGFLSLGLKKDDVVAIQLPNVAEVVLVRVALLKAGLIALPILLFFRQRELLYVLDYVDARAIVTCRMHRGLDYAAMVTEMRPQLPQLKYHFVVDDEVPAGTISVREIMETPLERGGSLERSRQFRFGLDEVSYLSMTSGTTGTPKIVQNVEAVWTHVSQVSAKRWRYSPDDILIALAPMAGGPSGHPCFQIVPLIGAKMVLLERFEPEAALALMERERVTVATGVPAQMTMIVKHPNLGKYDLSSLRAFSFGGSVCPAAVAEEIEEKMACHIITRYGMIDAGSFTGTNYDDPPHVRRRSVGKPLDGQEVRLVDDGDRDVASGEAGEVVVRGPGCIPGFHKDEERTLQAWGEPDGWYHTGDLGRFDEEGNLYLVGRKKDMIIRGGQNIYPIEVESLLLTHPRIANVAVAAMPDDVMGEKACAFVIPKAGAALSFDEMIAFLRGKQIAPYKLPERLEIVDSLPLGSDGQKVLKNLLSEQVARTLEAEAAKGEGPGRE